jgi:hypothetical protein
MSNHKEEDKEEVKKEIEMIVGGVSMVLPR